MGTYTTNYNLFMPSVGETGWGTLVNGNFSTIDTTMKSLSNRVTTCESYGARIAAIENEVNGNLSCTSVTTSGKITGNGGIVGTTGTFSGTITAPYFDGVFKGYTVYLENSSSTAKPSVLSLNATNGPCQVVDIDVPQNVALSNFPCMLNRCINDKLGHGVVTNVINNSGQQMVIDVPDGLTLKCGNTTYNAGQTNVSTATINNIILRTQCYINGTCTYANQSIKIVNKWSSGVYMYAYYV